MPIQRRETDKDEWILFAADFLVDHMTDEGRVDIRDTQYPEGHLYLAGDLFPLLEAYTLSKQDKYLAAARRILDYLRRNQVESGAWTVGCYDVSGAETTTTLAGYGTHAELAKIEAVAMIGWPLTGVRKYERITGDEQYRPMVRKAIACLQNCWNEDRGFDDGVFPPLFKDVLGLLGLSL